MSERQTIFERDSKVITGKIALTGMAQIPSVSIEMIEKNLGSRKRRISQLTRTILGRAIGRRNRLYFW
jgi:hypothetical protein